MIKGRQISSREAGFVGSHGNEKLRPFMVAFFRANSSPTPHISHVIKATDGDVGNSHEEEDEDEDEDIVRSSRVRRQTRKNRKRSKDINEDYGSWNPYTDLDARLSRRSCQKKNLYVSFRDLGWQVKIRISLNLLNLELKNSTCNGKKWICESVKNATYE